MGFVRYKPLFKTYNSIIDEFRSSFPEEHKNLSLEELPLFDEKGNELFTNKKLSTLLHQSTDIAALLRGLLPPEDTALGTVSEVKLHFLGLTGVQWTALSVFVALIWGGITLAWRHPSSVVELGSGHDKFLIIHL